MPMQGIPRLKGYYPYRPAAWIRVTGEDAFSFLQSQFSNDLDGMEVGRVVYGLWLNHKGKVYGDSFIMQTAEDEFRLMSYATPEQVIGDKLDAYIVADDVELELGREAVAAISILFDGDEAWREAVGPGRWADIGEGDLYYFPTRRHEGEGYEVVGKQSAVEGLLKKLEGGKFGPYRLREGDIEAGRILRRIPAIPQDIGPGELPQEGRLEGAAVSFTKGCYLGQEVMSRLHSMGQVRRLLALVKAEGKLPYGSTIRSGSKKVGAVKTGIFWGDEYIALALISRSMGERRRGVERGTKAQSGGERPLTAQSDRGINLPLELEPELGR